MSEEKERVARCLILKYLESCMSLDGEHSEEIGYSLDCLKTAWNIDNPDIKLPGVSSIIDLIPSQKYDSAHALELKAQGNQALSAGDFDKAISLYTEAISCDPTQAVFYANRAAAYTKKGDNEKAIPDCEKAISLDPKYANAYSRLGYAYYSMNKIEQAREAYQRGLRVCPESESLRQNLESLPPPAMPHNNTQPPPTGGASFLSGLAGMFANNPGMMSQIQSRLSSPEVQALLQDPEMADLLQTLQSNPAGIMSMMGDPRVMRLFNAVMGQSTQ